MSGSLISFHRLGLFLVPAAALAWSATALAQDETGIAACGDIDVQAEAKCELEAGATCKVQCDSVEFTAACEGQCSGECSGEVTAECEATCAGTCDAECTVEGGEFDCQASCSAVCEGDCQAACEGSSDGAACVASCKGRCSASCQSSCEVEPPSAECQAKCEASCQGRCDVQASVACEVDCSGMCEAELKGECQADCDAEGSLFCDSQYVDHEDNLDECVGALQAVITSEVDGYSRGSSQCGDNSCSAEGEAGISCRIAEPKSSGSPGPAAALLAGLATVFVTRRRGR